MAPAADAVLSRSGLRFQENAEDALAAGIAMERGLGSNGQPPGYDDADPVVCLGRRVNDKAGLPGNGQAGIMLLHTFTYYSSVI